jgi:hypothetical protein
MGRIAAAVLEDGRFQYLSANSFVVGIGSIDHQFKVCSIQFGGDGSIYVSPSFARQPGVLSEITFTKDASSGSLVDMTAQGKLVTHVAKLSHHPTGDAGFSQTGKVMRRVHRQSFPLASGSGKVFDLKVMNLSQFPPLKEYGPDRGVIRFQFQTTMPEAVILTGRWIRKQDLLADIADGDPVIGPLVMVSTSGSAAAPVLRFLAGQPATYPFRDHLLILGVASGEPSKSSEPAMILAGGFDHPLPGRGPVGAIAWLYPFRPSLEHTLRMENIDWAPKEAR